MFVQTSIRKNYHFHNFDKRSNFAEYNIPQDTSDICYSSNKSEEFNLKKFYLMFLSWLTTKNYNTENDFQILNIFFEHSTCNYCIAWFRMTTYFCITVFVENCFGQIDQWLKWQKKIKWIILTVTKVNCITLNVRGS